MSAAVEVQTLNFIKNWSAQIQRPSSHKVPRSSIVPLEEAGLIGQAKWKSEIRIGEPSRYRKVIKGLQIASSLSF